MRLSYLQSTRKGQGSRRAAPRGREMPRSAEVPGRGARRVQRCCPVNPIERPPYVRRACEGGVALEVEAPDWRALLVAAELCLSDVLRPLGRFGTWTARRISATGAGHEAVMAHWLARVLLDHRETGFSTALVEVEKAE